MKKYLVKKTKTEDYEDKDLCDHYCGCKYSTERINDEIHKDSRKIDKKKTQGMKSPLCA